MLTLKGKLISVFQTPVKKNDDGKEYGGDDKLQILVSERLENGEQKAGLLTVGVNSAEEYKKQIGQDLTLPVRVSAYKDNLIIKVLV